MNTYIRFRNSLIKSVNRIFSFYLNDCIIEQLDNMDDVNHDIIVSIFLKGCIIGEFNLCLTNTTASGLTRQHVTADGKENNNDMVLDIAREFANQIVGTFTSYVQLHCNTVEISPPEVVNAVNKQPSRNNITLAFTTQYGAFAVIFDYKELHLL